MHTICATCKFERVLKCSLCRSSYGMAKKFSCIMLILKLLIGMARGKEWWNFQRLAQDVNGNDIDFRSLLSSGFQPSCEIRVKYWTSWLIQARNVLWSSLHGKIACCARALAAAFCLPEGQPSFSNCYQQYWLVTDQFIFLFPELFVISIIKWSPINQWRLLALFLFVISNIGWSPMDWCLFVCRMIC